MSKIGEETPIPVIDLFAGPGGLGEGFSRFHVDGNRRFQIALSIEKDPTAHQTLTLRAFFRQFPEGEAPPEYYDYLRGRITRERLFKKYEEEAEHAEAEARQLTLGEDDVRSLIDERVGGKKLWVLTGGPPCQAYSLAGRSRMLGAFSRNNGESDEQFEERRKQEFEKDHRHRLYREYLKILADHAPPVFVMENVKGILSSKLEGKPIFPEIRNDLKNPRKALNQEGDPLSYRIYSLSTPSPDLFGEELKPANFIIEAEKFGVPQARHRVILLGIRSDFTSALPSTLKEREDPVTLGEVIGDLPPRTSGLTKGDTANPRLVLRKITLTPWWFEMFDDPELEPVRQLMGRTLKGVANRPSRGRRFTATRGRRPLNDWYFDPDLQGICNHESRSHIPEDLHRYFFCACFGKKHKRAPHLRDFPKGLLPKHRNVKEAVKGQKFGDRFRVQLEDSPSTTVTSHISKDGHYFIHPDPKQCRSLTVREAARLQTFPDNYFFEGSRTSQFHQVGNAVPPYLAYQIAGIVYSLVPNRR